MSPSELNTPEPNTDCIYHWKVSPFSKLSKSVQRIACKELSACGEGKIFSGYLNVIRFCCDDLECSQNSEFDRCFQLSTRSLQNTRTLIIGPKVSIQSLQASPDEIHYSEGDSKDR